VSLNRMGIAARRTAGARNYNRPSMSGCLFRELDSVEMLVAMDSSDGPCWPAGTRAAIVDLGSDHALVEVVEQDGRAYGPYAVALSDMRLIAHAPPRPRAANATVSAATSPSQNAALRQICDVAGTRIPRRW
jgi:hypothetical protein